MAWLVEFDRIIRDDLAQNRLGVSRQVTLLLGLNSISPRELRLALNARVLRGHEDRLVLQEVKDHRRHIVGVVDGGLTAFLLTEHG